MQRLRPRPNCTGKSTLARVLLGLYTPDGGSVTVGGLAALEARRRGLCAAVFQDAVRYPGSLREAVAMGGGGNVDEALLAAGLEGVVAGLPRGAETPLGREFTGGVELSGGQWQRVALARALYRRAPFVVLDEQAAALNPLAEAEMYRRFRELVAGRTAVMITHRLGATRFVDRILVLEGGRITEEGSHNELLARGGTYTALYAAQAGWYR